MISDYNEHLSNFQIPMNAPRKPTIATHMPLAQTRRGLSSVLARPDSRVLEYSVKVLLRQDVLIPVPLLGVKHSNLFD